MLTETQCRNAKPAEKPRKLPDGKGLWLEVKPNGTKAWRYRFELVHEGVRKESMFAIGEYAHVSGKETEEEAQVRRNGGRFTSAEARKERDRARALVKQGINPAHNRKLDQIKREQAAGNTFEAVARRWIDLRDWEAITKKKRLEMLGRIVFPHVGMLPVAQITPAHVLDILKKADENNGASVREEAKRTMLAVFDFAISNVMIETNPVYPVRRALPANKTQHKAALTKEEIGQFMCDLTGYERNFQIVSVFKLLWLTLCRPSEVTEAQWDEFDVEAGIWRIPAGRMKKRKEHIVTLPRQAKEVLEGMKKFTGHRMHVFPHRDKRDEPMTGHALHQALKNMGWSGRYSPHATRTTGSTHLNEMGFNADWIERQLAHADQNGVRRTYNHAGFLEQRKTMMQQWADMLGTLEKNEKEKRLAVADFRKRA